MKHISFIQMFIILQSRCWLLLFLRRKKLIKERSLFFLSLVSLPLSCANYFHKYKFSPPNNWCMFIREVLSFASFRSLFHLASAICAEIQTQRQTDTHAHTHRLPMGIVFTVLWINRFSMLYLPWYWSVTDRLYTRTHLPTNHNGTMWSCFCQIVNMERNKVWTLL